MAQTLTFYPLGNAETCLLELENGGKILFDYADMNDGSTTDERYDLEKALSSFDKFDVVMFSHAHEDHTNELLLGAGEQITGVEATSTADSLPDLPQLEQGYPMPDPTVDFAQMYQFGYTDGNTMLPLSKERARELFLQDVPIFVLNSDNTEYMVLDTSDLDAHSGIFGVERTEWERVRDTLQPRCDIVAPKQPDAVSYLHDDTAKTQPENYLKNAEMALEDDYGMIDGIINNGPKQTVAEQEERSSILAKLKAPVETTNRTEKHAPKRSAEKEL